MPKRIKAGTFKAPKSMVLLLCHPWHLSSVLRGGYVLGKRLRAPRCETFVVVSFLDESKHALIIYIGLSPRFWSRLVAQKEVMMVGGGEEPSNTEILSHPFLLWMASFCIFSPFWSYCTPKRWKVSLILNFGNDNKLLLSIVRWLCYFSWKRHLWNELVQKDILK